MRLRQLLAGACLISGALVLVAPAVAGATSSETALASKTAAISAPSTTAAANHQGGIDIVDIEGLFDETNLGFALDSIKQANERGSSMVVLQLDSDGTVDADVTRLLDAIARSAVPVAAWVGPSGSNAPGSVALIVAAAHVNGIAQGSNIGPAYPLTVDGEHEMSRAAVTRTIAALEKSRGRDGRSAARVTSHSLNATAAVGDGVVERISPTLGDFIVQLNGKTVKTASGIHKLVTAKVIGTGNDRKLRPSQEFRFLSPGLTDQVTHTLNQPGIAYLLFTIGLALILFEFFTAGIGLAGLVGAFALVGAFVGFSHLPVRDWAVALIVLSVVAYAVDIQAQIAKAWTAIGTVLFVVGSLFLYDSDVLTPSWWVYALLIAGVLLFMLTAMPSMVRARFSTPTIGRDGLVGEEGRAETAVNPDGVVRVRDALWRARTNRATPIASGEPMRVVEIQGLLLEVEPLEGGAIDYRDAGRKRGGTETAGAPDSDESEDSAG
jgi:membrane-bound serine protease (ClpP class)